jgi:hypothetical protein
LRKSYITAAIISFFAFSLFGIDAYVANWNVYADSATVSVSGDEQDFEKILLARLSQEDFGGYLAIKPVTMFARYEHSVTKSTLDASELCEQTLIDYLLYGSLRKTDQYFDAELKVYDNQKKEVRKIIYAKAGAGELSIIVRTLSDQTAGYLRDILGIASKVKERNKAWSGFYLQGGAGYWLPVGSWSSFLTGICTIETGATIIPTIIVPSDSWNNFYLRLGVLVSYNLGINQPGFEESFLHSVELRIPILASWEIAPQHVIWTGIAPVFQIDILVQNPILNDGRMDLATGFGLSIPFGYEYWFSEARDLAIGITASFDLIFYNEILMTPKCSIYMNYRLSNPRTAEKEDGGKS